MAFPEYDALPYRKGHGDPDKALWGVFGDNEPYGMLNLQTPEHVQKSCQEEVRTGHMVSLNWRLQFPDIPTFGRPAARHRAFKMHPTKPINDDELEFNTQSGSQWDGFRHWGYYKTDQFWLGQPQADIVGPGAGSADLGRNSIHHWAERGIAGRGVLLDYWAWSETAGRNPYSPISQHPITTDELDAVAAHQGTQLRVGDMLFIRTGFIKWNNEATRAQKQKLADVTPPSIVGIVQSEQSVRWLYDHHFSTIAADNTSVELRPTVQDWNLHDYLLPLWGTPIGELFDLEALSGKCRDLKRYSFFVTSAPLNVYGGIASPPNAIAIF